MTPFWAPFGHTWDHLGDFGLPIRVKITSKMRVRIPDLKKERKREEKGEKKRGKRRENERKKERKREEN